MIVFFREFVYNFYIKFLVLIFGLVEAHTVAFVLWVLITLSSV